MVRTVIENGLVVTMDGRRTVIAEGHVVIEGETITTVDSGRPSTAPGDVVVDAAGCAVLPGFVNTHHHLAATLLRGLSADRPLRVTVNAESPTMALHRVQDEAECHAGALLAAVELTRSGVTTTTDSQSPWKGMRKGHGSLRAATESGLRVVYSPAFVNRTAMVPPEHHFGVDEAVAEFERLRDTWSGDLVSVIPEVMSLPRGTDELITALHRAGDGRMAMHLTYSAELAEWAQREYGHSAIEHLDRLGVLGEGFLGAHPVYLSDAEVERYGERGAAGAYCAVSNMLIGVDHLSIARLQAAGIRVGLGLDYPNHTHNFFETTKMSLLAQKQLAHDAGVGDAGVALGWATIDGAAALGLADRIGSLEPGKLADLQLVDLHRAHLWPPAAALSLLVYSGAAEAVRDVMVNGRWLMRDRELVHLDESAVLAQAARGQAYVAQAAGLSPAPRPASPPPVLVPDGWTLLQAPDSDRGRL
ncbi:amidohydrolase family protein [Micromonospora carbonacea]|uniref:5-methylthioadenosine/S-adenosylhomocysteine deaminase n=1 Tax=Micromonospora carbonacea TaxID=47853 RepID=A0A1C4V8N3_9ACTN|nr:amidohydrolase family protein [Micromonospora carbonacea]SCE80151.1 5-methylthioadenosine/S-adenosylhomocysteine deaminase [Micromonospora carbonacea]